MIGSHTSDSAHKFKKNLLLALHDRAQKMLTEAQASYVGNSTSSSDMDPTVPAGFVDSLEERSPLTRNF